jgi:hypothetical protein
LIVLAAVTEERSPRTIMMTDDAPVYRSLGKE